MTGRRHTRGSELGQKAFAARSTIHHKFACGFWASSAILALPCPVHAQAASWMQAGLGGNCIWLATPPCKALRVAALVRDCLNISRTERRTLIPDREPMKPLPNAHGFLQLCIWASRDRGPDPGVCGLQNPWASIFSSLAAEWRFFWTRACYFWVCLQEKEFQAPKGSQFSPRRIKKGRAVLQAAASGPKRDPLGGCRGNAACLHFTSPDTGLLPRRAER
jgi:hypothetical protein